MRGRLAGLAGAALFLHVLVLGLALDRWCPLDPNAFPRACVVTDKNGMPLRAFADARGVWRFPAGPGDVSPLYLEALLAYEDRYFYNHPGINPLALARALVQNLTSGRVVSGGSTITMQTARVMGLTAGSGITRKLVQMLRAIQLEYHFTKKEILSLYLTHAPFGANIQGVRAAAHTWLGRDARDLTHAEAALLAVLPQAPSRLRPDRHPKAAQKARDKVLDRLQGCGTWPEETIASARQETVVPCRFPSPMAAPLAARRLKAQYPRARVIRTFLDQDLQNHVAGLLRQYVAALPPRQSGAVMVVDAGTMAVLAYAGSSDFANSTRQGHVDMIRAFRSPGSALKPFIYAMALDEGLIHSHSMLLDVPRIGKPYDPGNFTGGFQGPVTAVRALQDSLNLPAVQVLEGLGPGRFHDRLRHAGARFRFQGKPNLSMALGGVGTDLESLAGLYSALARDGVAGRPRLVPEDPESGRYLMSPGAAYITRQMLTRPLPGREQIARLAGDRLPAWKTGTSYGFRDAWALGVRDRFIVGVWIGRPDGTPSPGLYGAVTAVPLLSLVMESLEPSGPPTRAPASVTQETVCWPSGLAEARLRAGRELPEGACVRRHKAWLLNGQAPPTMRDDRGLAAPLIQTLWVDGNGRQATPLCGGVKTRAYAFWPWQAEPFIPMAWRRAARLPEPSKNCPGLPPPASPGIRIISVADRSILTPQPGENSSVTIPLKALGGQGDRVWFLNSRPVSRGGAVSAMPMPVPGAYQLAVADEAGNSDVIRFKVTAQR